MELWNDLTGHLNARDQCKILFNALSKQEEAKGNLHFSKRLDKILLDMEISELTGEHQLTNIEERHRENLLKAAKLTGFNIRIDDKATYGDKDEHVLKGYISVVTLDVLKDHHVFWKKFYELRGLHIWEREKEN